MRKWRYEYAVGHNYHGPQLCHSKQACNKLSIMN
jgi:hypothetical protein